MQGGPCLLHSQAVTTPKMTQPLTLFCAPTAAPSWVNSSTTVAWPFSLARWRGVLSWVEDSLDKRRDGKEGYGLGGGQTCLCYLCSQGKRHAGPAPRQDAHGRSPPHSGAVSVGTVATMSELLDNAHRCPPQPILHDQQLLHFLLAKSTALPDPNDHSLLPCAEASFGTVGENKKKKGIPVPIIQPDPRR